jgi:hypothetical protein
MQYIGDYYSNQFASRGRRDREEGRVHGGVTKGFNYVRLGDDEDKYLSVIAGSKLVEFSISWSHRD